MNNNINNENIKTIENNNITSTTPVAQTTPVVQTTSVAQPTPVAQTTPVAQPTPVVQTTPVAQPTTAPTQEQPQSTNNTSETKDKNVLQYVPIILLILVLALGGYVGTNKITSLIAKNKNENVENNNQSEKNNTNNTNKNNQTNTKPDNKNENTTSDTNDENTTPDINTENNLNNDQNNNQPENNTNETCQTPIIWNGVYTNGENTITLYQIESDKINYTVNINSHLITGIADEIIENKASGEIFETHTFELCNETLTFTTTDKDIPTTIFTKNKDYTQTDFYKDSYGDPAFLNTELNGIFKKDNTTIKLFQTSQTSAILTIINDNYHFNKSINVNGNTLSYEDDFFDEVQKINITITNNTLVLTASSTDQESNLNKCDGTYTKESAYTIEQIIKDN